MKVELLGCSGASAPGMRTTSLSVGPRVAVDAGCLAQALSLEQQGALTDVFLSHSHLDHVASLPLLLDNRMALRSPALRIHAGPTTLDALRQHVFNGVLWPTLDDLNSALPTAELHAIRAGDRVDVEAGFSVEALDFVHTVPTLGFRVRHGTQTTIVAGDTGDTLAAQEQLDEGGVDLLFLECSWPRRLQNLARLTGHMTPRDLETLTLPADTRLVVTHLKPVFHTDIRTELEETRLPHTLGRDGASWESSR